MKAIEREEFQSLMRPFAVAENERIGIAVSGGPDSMALAFCLARYLKEDLEVTSTLASSRGALAPWRSSSKDSQSALLKMDCLAPTRLCSSNFGAAKGARNDPRFCESSSTKLYAFIVEHGLRDESAAEAQTVAANLKAMGIEVEILPWHHEAVKTKVHVKARHARYELLADACVKHNIAKLFFAHHADDQAETVLMRFAKGSGIDGLAGMAPLTDYDDIQLCRPLLSVPKVQLVATCDVNKIPYVIDPSNAADKYARGRLRRVRPLLEAEGFNTERLVDLADRAREAKDALDYYATSFLASSSTVMEGAALRLDLTSLRGQPRAIVHRALAMILAWFEPEAYPPERRQLVPIADWLLDQDDSEARTFHGCLIQKGETCDKATFIRELAAITDEVSLSIGEEKLWDCRWLVRAGKDPPRGVTIRPLGILSHDATDALAPSLRKSIPQGRVRACLPSLWVGEKLWDVPCFNAQNQGVAQAFFRPPFWVKSTLR